jgi:histone H3/H4
MTQLSQAAWRHCNMCKVAIGFEAEYFICSVSTCNRKRTGLFFCSLACFEAHLPTARHRDAWAERQRSPSVAAARAEREAEESEAASEAEGAATDPPGGTPARRIVAPAAPARAASDEQEDAGDSGADVLIVVSKLKKYVRERSGMNTSDGVVALLSDHLRELCREAIRQAGQDGRRTVLDRDFTKVLEQLVGASREGNFRSRR